MTVLSSGRCKSNRPLYISDQSFFMQQIVYQRTHNFTHIYIYKKKTNSVLNRSPFINIVPPYKFSRGGLKDLIAQYISTILFTVRYIPLGHRTLKYSSY